MIQELLSYFDPLDYLGIWLLTTFVMAFLVSWGTFPTIIKISQVKQLMDEPGSRSAHSVKTPTLGGIGIFFSLAVVITSIGGLLDTKILMLLLGGMTVLFFLGLKDDLLILSPRTKFLAQIMVASVLILFTDTRILGFSGVFGITTLPYVVSVLFTLFVYILIINAYNLIDGVDGLAGTLALFASMGFAYLFWTMEDVSMITISIAMLGALLPFLRLNFSNRNKIFMGDTGSMLLGFLLSFLIVRFIGESQMQPSSEFNSSSPVIGLALVFFPLLDTLRIFFIRAVIHKKSPFKADKNHLHHRFLALGYSHKQTTAFVVLINALLFLIVLFLQDLEIHLQFCLLLIIGTVMYSIVFLYHYFNNTKSKSEIA